VRCADVVGSIRENHRILAYKRIPPVNTVATASKVGTTDDGRPLRAIARGQHEIIELAEHRRPAPRLR
jgi:hypothetical protein